MRHKAVAQGLSSSFATHGTFIFIANFPATGFKVTFTGMPNFDVISRLFVLDLGHSSLVVPICKLLLLNLETKACYSACNEKRQLHLTSGKFSIAS